MAVGYYVWSKTDEQVKNRILRRAQQDIEDVTKSVSEILENVRLHGDRAIREYAERFDKATLRDLRVTEEEFEIARKTIDPKLADAITRCAGNVRKFNEEQMRRVEKNWIVEIEPGVFGGELVTPVSSIGLYVPGGKNLFPSTLYMLAVPAVVAQVPRIIICTPSRPDGTVSEVLLFAAEISGVKEIYKVGGAQAIAAMAYGTETVPKVAKVIGPTSPYGAAAKQLLAGVIDPGMPAGPSESIILCDESADPYNTALDVLNEAEHGPDSAGILITHDKNLADSVHKHLEEMIAELPEPQRGWLNTNMESYGGVILTDSLDDSIALSNRYAPEHVYLKMRDVDAILPRIQNAGEILIGENTPSVLGNYGIGTTHVLPTGGMAHSYSCTSIWDYLKRISVARVTAEGLNVLSPSVLAVADYEGFPAHANAIRQRKIFND
jgi:histidinol dehydrogenase